MDDDSRTSNSDDLDSRDVSTRFEGVAAILNLVQNVTVFAAKDRSELTLRKSGNQAEHDRQGELDEEAGLHLD